MTAEIVVSVDLSAVEARELTDRIRQTLRVGHDLIVRAFEGRAWTALGYESWDAYCAGEFADARMVRLDREQRREIVAQMRDAGMSTRAIGSAIGASVGTVHQDIAATVQNRTDEPAAITSLDGRIRPATRPAPAVHHGQPVDTITGEIGVERQPNRRPLVDAFFDATRDLARVTERLARLAEDDRWPRNAEQVTAKHRSDLIRAVDALTGVLNRMS